MNRHRKLSYWAARFMLNALAVSAFRIGLKLINVEFSWWLYTCAFVVYVIISLGDELIDEIWPRTATQSSWIRSGDERDSYPRLP